MSSSKQRVLCISDSLGLPRDGVDYADTWFAQLKALNSDCDFIAIFKRNETTHCLSSANYKEYLWWYKPQSVVLQLGICDCAPRYMRASSLLYKLVYRLPSKLKSLFWKCYKKTHKRSINNADVTPNLFEQHVENYCKSCDDYGLERLIIVKIATPAKSMVNANPTIMEAIELYNGIYDKVAQKYTFCTIVNPLYEPAPDHYVADGYHPNTKGNKLVAEALNSILTIT